MLLDFVDRYGGERGVVALPGANADHLFERLDEDLPVAYRACARRSDDRVDGCRNEGLRARHLDLDLFVELHEELRSSPDRDRVTLPAVTARAGDGDSSDAGAEQCFLDGCKSIGTDDAADEFHRSCSSRRDEWTYVVPCCGAGVTFRRCIGMAEWLEDPQDVQRDGRLALCGRVEFLDEQIVARVVIAQIASHGHAVTHLPRRPARAPP